MKDNASVMEAYVMVGAPGSGKSTQVAKLMALHPDAVVLSGDEIRAELYGNADIQGNYTEIHDRMLEILEENVGRTIIMDGTHYKAAYRKEALAMLNSYGYTNVSAVVVDKSLAVCLKQNASRDRKVPEHVIERMHNSLQASLKNIYNEKFSHINFVY
jgi:predicted kinase